MGIFKEIQAHLHNEWLLTESWGMDEMKMAVHIYEQDKMIVRLARILYNTGNFDSIPKELRDTIQFLKDIEDEVGDAIREEAEMEWRATRD